MPLLDDPPANLINDTMLAFSISSDVKRITVTNDNLTALQKSRAKEVDEARTALRALSRTLETTKQSTESAVAASTQRDHSTTMNNLDREKFSLAKGINELESSSHNLAGTLARLKEELESLEGEGVMQSTNVLSEDETLLRLKVYRSFGIELEEDGAGGYSKAVVHNAKRGDVHVLNLDKKMRRTFYTNYFWNSI